MEALIREPFSLRISDRRDPERGDKFGQTLDLKKANPTDVLRALIDAYIETGGDINFPVRIVSAAPAPRKRR